MDITLSKDQTKPGTTCDLEIKTWENSSVSILGVDQSVILMRSGNDITRDRVAADLMGYIANEDDSGLKITGNKDRYLEFGESAAFILTNALEGSISCSNVRTDGGDNELENRDTSGVEDSGGNRHDPNQPDVRKNFPETWIFADFTANADGTYKLPNIKVPDTISSFIVTGFAIHPEKGLGIASKKKITVMQEFFLKLYVPYSIRIGEVLKVDVTVFNYISRPKRDVTAEVTMFNKYNEFEFIDPTKRNSDCLKLPSSDTKKTKTITVRTGDGAPTFFFIRTLVLGEIKINVRASTSNLGDEVEKSLLVNAEGITHYKNEAKVFDLNDSRDSYNFKVHIASEGVMKNSVKVQTSVIGNLMGPSLFNVDNMV